MSEKSDKIESLLTLAQEKAASDLHLNVGRPPIIRVDGKLEKLDHHSELEENEIQAILESVANKTQVQKFFDRRELDFSYDSPVLGRFRVNACRQKGSISLAFRLLMRVLCPLSALGLPSIYGEICLKPRGLILVTGPTGSGKSTSMAAMINHINDNAERHIVTIEDPIEYVYKDNKSMIIQRCVGDDTESFATALKHTLRHDPDVIVVGEMRDLDTIAIAISAAETGHLVFGTLHTIDARETVDRVVEVFPTGQQAQVRLQLSQVLLAVLSQTLVRRIGGGRIPACEIMISNSAIRNLIREGLVHQLYSQIQLGQKEGMQTLEQSLADLVDNNIVQKEEASKHCSESERFEQALRYTRGMYCGVTYTDNAQFTTQ
jgi:twitching motility protein PilT